jgi:two-component system chemotaxis response regulator CheY
VALILTVDDSTTMRQMVSFTLSGVGHEVAEAANVDEALALVGEMQFELIIADVNMPGRNGIELVRELRQLPDYQFTPILMLTTVWQPELKHASKAAGATGWIIKPFDPDTLLSVLHRVLPNGEHKVVTRG